MFFDEVMAPEVAKIHNENACMIDSFLEKLCAYFTDRSPNEVTCIVNCIKNYCNSVNFISHACSNRVWVVKIML